MEWMLFYIPEAFCNHFYKTELVCRVISYYYNKDITHKQIYRTDNQKPYIIKNDCGDVGKFNYAHSKNYLFIAFNNYSEVGVDIEEIKRNRKNICSVLSIFTDEERSYVEQLDLELKKEAILKIWVQKEAIGKALGIGLMYDTTKVNVYYCLDGMINEHHVIINNKEVSLRVWKQDECYLCIAWL